MSLELLNSLASLGTKKTKDVYRVKIVGCENFDSTAKMMPAQKTAHFISSEKLIRR